MGNFIYQVIYYLLMSVDESEKLKALVIGQQKYILTLEKTLKIKSELDIGSSETINFLQYKKQIKDILGGSDNKLSGSDNKLSGSDNKLSSSDNKLSGSDNDLSIQQIIDNIENDFERFSNLHSWYKHMDKFEILYPILMQGEEPRYEFDKRFVDNNQGNLHWRFVREINMKRYGIKFKNKYLHPSKDLFKYIKSYPIYVNNHICSNKDNNDLKLFFVISAKKICKRFLKDILL